MVRPLKLSLTKAIEESIVALIKPSLSASACIRGELRAVLRREANQVFCNCELAGFTNNDEAILLECTPPIISHLSSACPTDIGEYVVEVRVNSIKVQKNKVELHDSNLIFNSTLAKENREKSERIAARNLKLFGTNDSSKINAMPFGKDISIRFANWLVKNRFFGYGHRDYCGMGFKYDSGRFAYGEIYDGDFAEAKEIFESQDSFVRWLQSQSNISLSRCTESDRFVHENQTITLDRLLDAIG